MRKNNIHPFSNALAEVSKAIYEFWKQYPDMDIVAFITTLAGLNDCRNREVSVNYELSYGNNEKSIAFYGCVTWTLYVPKLIGLLWEQKIVRLYIPYLFDLENGTQCFFVLENGNKEEALTFLKEISGVFKKTLSLDKIPKN